MTNKTSTNNFRLDINGLRAWAVLLVLLYHFQVPGFHSGFIGVDIFFVISGFLMTGIINKGLVSSNFSLLNFYLARFRRILPALAILVISLFIFGYYWLVNHDYSNLAREAKYALSFISNIDYSKTAGYFDSQSAEKWLLHTWSLGIEMQFYILFPILAILLWKLLPSQKAFLLFLCLVFATSLTASIYLSNTNKNIAFYLLHSRAWELAAGGLVYMLAQQKHKLNTNLVFYSGVILLVLGFFIINDGLAWPSYWALLPVVGTSLIILANKDSSLLINTYPTQWLGKISYSVYLWHWPLVVWLVYAEISPNFYVASSYVALSLLLGFISYKLIEIPTQKYLRIKSLQIQALVLCLFAFAIAGLVNHLRTTEFEGRLSPQIELAAAEIKNQDPRIKECFLNSYKKQPCSYGDNLGNEEVILLGDSHAASTITALSSVSNRIDINTLFIGAMGCPLIKNMNLITALSCKSYTNWAINKANVTKSNKLVFINRTSLYFLGANEIANNGLVAYFSDPSVTNASKELILEFKENYISTVCNLQEAKQVYLVRPIPEMGINVPNTISKALLFGKPIEDIKISKTDYYERQKHSYEIQDAAVKQCGAKVLDPIPYLCDEEFCYGSKNLRPLYYDDNHLSEYGNKLLIPMFEEIFR